MNKNDVLKLIFLFAIFTNGAFGQIPTITENVATDFEFYKPCSNSFSPSVASYSVKENLSNLLFTENYSLSEDAKEKLVSNGFVAVPSTTNKLYEVYKETRESGLPVFVTTDAMLHSFHIIYDYMLRIAEHERFYFQLEEMLSGMITDIRPLLDYERDDSLMTAIIRTAAFLDVANTLLTNESTFEQAVIKEMVSAELQLIEAHKGFDSSEVIKELYEDFSQYVPRGHYTRNERFKRYFKSMMYLGRIGFRLGTEEKPGSSSMETMQACILTRILAMNNDVSALWEMIYRPTVFFVGRSDDLNYKEYKEVLDEVLGESWSNDDIDILKTNLDTILTALRKLRPPLILSGFCMDYDDPAEVTKGFRVMGQRFIPDSYILGKLVYAKIAGERYMPRGLDIFAVLGSERAYKHLIDLYLEDQYAGYVDTLDALKEQFTSKPASQWAENLYWNWLYVLIPLLKDIQEGYPMFMTTVAWADKTLTTASGSWAELRHETIQYAKQSYTQERGIPDNKHCPMRQGYVEPNPEVFARLAALGRFMKEGFENSDLSDILPLSKLETFSDICISLRDIAIKELEGGNISSFEYNETIGNIGPALESLEDFSDYSFASEQEQQQGIESDADTTMAVIADVHTDPNTQRVLEVGVGKAMDIYVAVPIEGRIVLCRGGMFSYYEFKHPMEDRLTDEQWQGMLADNTAPPMPEWTQSYMYDSIGTLQAGEYNIIIDNIDVEVENVYREEDTIIISIVSDSVPKVTVYASDIISGQETDHITIEAVSQNDGTYRALIPSMLLLSNDSMIAEVTLGDVSYRKLLKKGVSSDIIFYKKKDYGKNLFTLHGRTLLLLSEAGCSVFNIKGRKLFDIPRGVRRFDIPRNISDNVLFLAGTMEGVKQVYRIILHK